MAEAQQSSGRFKGKITILVTLLMLVLTGMTYAYVSHQEGKAEDAKLPKPSLNKLLKDFRVYHKNVGRFPETFEAVQEEVWKLKRAPAFGDKGRSFTMRNYYYLMERITPHATTLWAAPINEKFREGNTFFLVVYPDREEIWKGPALEPGEFASLPANPTEYQLSTMGLTKQLASAKNSNGKNSNAKK